MTKRETWYFAVLSTGLFSALFLALTFHSHTRFGDLTNASELTPMVKRGKEVWHEYNCVNCHTLFGEGAYYAPDLTNIASQRGDQYLIQFMKDPSQFYSVDDYGRLMPDLDMTDKEIRQVVAFLGWIDKVHNQDWPPRPIRVTGSPVSRTRKAAGSPPSGAVAQGRALFSSEEAGCDACHSTAEGVKIVGPSMAGLQSRAKKIIDRDGYTGDATTVKEYIRESILQPDAYIVPGKNHANNGVSLMPGNYKQRLRDKQVDQLVQYLMTLK